MLQLLDSGLDSSRLELIGFSLGGQLTGSVARFVNLKSSGRYKVPRIVALEPSILTTLPLQSGDASFVMTMHTERVFSNRSINGDVAFWVNGGISQPMCGIFPIGKFRKRDIDNYQSSF